MQKKTSDNTKTNTRVLVKVAIPDKKLDEAKQKVYKDIAKKTKLPGFRIGKAPIELIKKKVNEFEVFNKAINSIIMDLYFEAIKKQNIEPFSSPLFENLKYEKDKKQWVVDAYVAKKPVAHIKGYKDIVKKAKKQAQKAIDGQKKDVKDIKVSFDEKNKKTSEKDSDKNKKEENFILQSIAKALVENIKVEIDELIIKDRINHELKLLDYDLKRMGMDFKTYLKKAKITEEEFFKNLENIVTSQLKLDTILSTIAEEENPKVSDKDIDEFLKASKLSDEKIKELKKDEKYIQNIKKQIQRNKIVDSFLA